MPTTEDYINQLKTDKNDLVNNLIEKGVAASADETFTSLVPKVLSIQSGEEVAKPNYVLFRDYTGTTLDISWLRTDNMTTMNSMFRDCDKVISLDCSNFNTSNVTNMSYMFSIDTSSQGGALTRIDGLSNFDTSNVTTMTYMFTGCSKVANMNDIKDWDVSKVSYLSYMFQYYNPSSIDGNLIDLSNWNLTSAKSFSYMFQNAFSTRPDSNLVVNLTGLCKSNITNTSYMFYNSVFISQIIFDDWDTANVTDMTSMFYTSASHQQETKLDLSSFETPNLTKCNSLFNGRAYLEELDIRKMTFDKVTTFTNMLNKVPTTCKIIVKDDDVKEWFATNFSTYTNVITVAELG